MTVVALFALLLSSGIARAQDSEADAVALLNRMVEAERTLAVEGRVSEHIALPGVTPDPTGRSFALPAGITPVLIERAFQLQLAEPTTVAGRKVDVLELRGRGPLTPDWTFWIDDATGARVAYQLSDSSGKVVAAGRYERITQVRPRSVPRDLPSPMRVDDETTVARLLDPGLAPDGYVAIRLQRTSLGRADVPALRVTYWDGLDALVVLIYRRQPSLTEDTDHLVSQHIGRFSVSVIGAAPDQALTAWLQRIASGPLARLDPARTLRQND